MCIYIWYMMIYEYDFWKDKDLFTKGHIPATALRMVDLPAPSSPQIMTPDPRGTCCSGRTMQRPKLHWVMMGDGCVLPFFLFCFRCYCIFWISACASAFPHSLCRKFAMKTLAWSAVLLYEAKRNQQKFT